MKLNFPEYTFRIKEEEGKQLIFDEIRRNFVVLTPEERVRQHVIRFLVKEKGFPASLLAIEKAICINQNNLRCDIVGYNRKGEPFLIVECKAPEVNITQNAFNQIVRYNMKLKVAYLLVTNGLKHYCCKMDYDNMSYAFIEEIPSFSSIVRWLDF